MSKVSFTPKEEAAEPRPAPRGNLSRSNSSNNTRPGSAEKSKDEKPLYVPEMQYNHAAPHDVLDDAHTAAKRIGEAPPQPMTRQLTRGNTLANLRSAAKNTDVETDEEREVVRRKSIFVAQQAVFKVEKDEKSGKEKEVRKGPAPRTKRCGEGAEGEGGGGCVCARGFGARGSGGAGCTLSFLPCTSRQPSVNRFHPPLRGR